MSEGMYDKRKDPERTQEIKMEKHTLKLSDKMGKKSKWTTMFGEKHNQVYYYKGIAQYVYMIRNTKTGKMYIGQTQDLEQRKKQHLSALKGMTHKNTEMQIDFILFGSDSFIFEILGFYSEECDILKKEKNIVSLFSAEYPMGYNAPYDSREDFKERISKLLFDMSISEIKKLKEERQSKRNELDELRIRVMSRYRGIKK